MLHPDDTVNFRGWRFGAQGKVILLAKLERGEKLPGEVHTVTLSNRAGAAFADGVFFVLIGFVIALVLESSANITYPAHWVTVAGACLYIAYHAIITPVIGKTIGKAATNYYVADLDGGPISTKTSWIRALSGRGYILIIAGFAAHEALNGRHGLLTLEVVIGVVAAYPIANLLTAWVRPDNRAIHDLIAGTCVTPTAPAKPTPAQ